MFGEQIKITHGKLKPEINECKKSALGYFSNLPFPQTQLKTSQTHILEAREYFLHF